MALFLIVSEIYGRKVSKWWKIRNFFELFGPPCRNALDDLDGSTPECAQVCALRIGLHLASLREIEMVAVLCTNETTPMSFSLFLPPTGVADPQKGRRHVPTQATPACKICHIQLSLNVHRIRFRPTQSIWVWLSGLRLYLQSDRDKTLQKRNHGTDHTRLTTSRVIWR